MRIGKFLLMLMIIFFAFYYFSCFNLNNIINQNYIDAKRYYNEDDYANALIYINKAIEKDNKQDSFYLLKAYILYEDRAPIDDVITECDKALQLNSDNVEAKILKANCLVIMEDENYKSIMDEIVSQTYSDVYTLVNIAHVYYTGENYTQALKYYNDALIIEKDNKDIKYSMVRCYVNLQDYDNAGNLCDEILNVYHEDVDTLNEKIYILNEQEKYEEAIDLCYETIKIDSEDSIIYYELYYSYLCLGDYESALEYINKYIEFNPDTTNAFLYRARLNKILDDIEGMERDLQTYIDKGGNEEEGNEFLTY